MLRSALFEFLTRGKSEEKKRRTEEVKTSNLKLINLRISEIAEAKKETDMKLKQSKKMTMPVAKIVLWLACQKKGIEIYEIV